uniref:Prostaglandin reductase 1 n=2 Tax=Dendroctonus ponderosae TaxID=77166 RepID=A0AAR5PKG4_DENPD
MVAKKYVLVIRSEGFPKSSDFKLVEETLPELKENEYLAEAVFLSVDPYMRAYMPSLEPNTTMIGSQVAKIVESKNPDFPVGKYVVGGFGLRSHTIATAETKSELGFNTFLLPHFNNLPLSLALGVLGMPGNTAYFGLLELCQPKPEDTVVVSAAAGAVGSIVGQIAKIKGCTVIGIAGSNEKGKWLTEELGFDYFINYKTQNVEEELRKAAPKGVDCYFDNVGGDISVTVINQMKPFGRVAICGDISSYNATEPAKIISPIRSILFNELKVQGFRVSSWNERWLEGIHKNLRWIIDGKLKYRETITEGFDNIFKAFTEMLQGGNIGKASVKV